MKINWPTFYKREQMRHATWGKGGNTASGVGGAGGEVEFVKSLKKDPYETKGF